MTGPTALNDGHEHWPRYTDPAQLLARTETRLAQAIDLLRRERERHNETYRDLDELSTLHSGREYWTEVFEEQANRDIADLTADNARLRAELAQARAWAKTWKALCKWYWTHGHIAAAPGQPGEPK